jgi:hypothetical protein
LKIHPARYPRGLPEFFIKMLTDVSLFSTPWTKETFGPVQMGREIKVGSGPRSTFI